MLLGARVGIFSNGDEAMYKELYEMLCQGVDAVISNTPAPTVPITYETPTLIKGGKFTGVPSGDYTFTNVTSVQGANAIQDIKSNAIIRLPKCTSIGSNSISYSYGANAHVYIPLMNHMTFSTAPGIIFHWADGVYKGDGTPVT